MRTFAKIVILQIFQFLSFSIYSQEINLKSIDSLKWDKRLLILNTNEKDSAIRKSTSRFVKKSQCYFDERNLIFIEFINEQSEDFESPYFIKNLYGLWLIGYDGKIKSYSSDGLILDKIFFKIDQMPMRIEEMKNQIARCE